MVTFISFIDRETQSAITQITTHDQGKFSKSSGYQFGNKHCAIAMSESDPYRQLMTQEEFQQISIQQKKTRRRNKLARKLQDTKWRNFDVETLEAVQAILSRAAQQGK